jgi:hypothetical protein
MTEEDNDFVKQPILRWDHATKKLKEEPRGPSTYIGETLSHHSISNTKVVIKKHSSNAEVKKWLAENCKHRWICHLTANFGNHSEFTYTFSNQYDAMKFRTALAHELIHPTDMNLLQDVIQATLPEETIKETFADSIKRIAFTEPYNVETIHSIVHSYKITRMFSEEKNVLRTFGDEQKHKVVLSKKTLNYEIITEALRWCIGNVNRGKWSVRGKKNLCEMGLPLPSRLESESVVFSFSQKTTADIFSGKFSELNCCCYMDTEQQHKVIVRKSVHSETSDTEFLREIIEWIEENTNGFWAVKRNSALPPNHRPDGFLFSFDDVQDASYFRLRF